MGLIYSLCFAYKINAYRVLGLILTNIPEGNYIYKDHNGINQLELDWNKGIMLGMRVEWRDMVPTWEVVH